MAEFVRIYIGTYTGGSSEGIYVYRMDLSSGELTYESHVASDNPSFLALAPNLKHLYAVNELGDPGGTVSAYAIDQNTGGLTLINQQPAHGTLPCSICVDATGQCVLVANYGSGTVSAYPIQNKGSLGEATTRIQHEGSSINPDRQQEPHAHMIITDPANRYAFVPDLGMDKIMIYKLDPDQGTLTPNDTPSVSVKPGNGPRHLTFHPSDKYAYVINEIGSTITAFTYDGENGVLEEIQMVDTLPADYTGRNGTADIHVTSDGKFLYGSNRGHDSLAIYSINDDGTLNSVDIVSTGGENPRNFGIDPTGTYLLAGNQSTDNVTTFRMNHETGGLTEICKTDIPAAVCLKMIKIDG